MKLLGTVNTSQYGVCALMEGFYDNGRQAIVVEGRHQYNGERIGTLTVNIPEATLGTGEVLVKTWSENERLAKDVLAAGLFEDTGRRVPTGWVEAEVWRWKAPK